MGSVAVQLLSRIQLFAAPWTAACRLPCSSPSPRVCSNSCPLSRWCHPTISSSVIPSSSCLQFFPIILDFSSESALCIRWPKCWSFNFIITPSNEYSGLAIFINIKYTFKLNVEKKMYFLVIIHLYNWTNDSSIHFPCVYWMKGVPHTTENSWNTRWTS